MFIDIFFPIEQTNIAVILNGHRDALQQLQNNWHGYQLVVVCDGAWHDVERKFLSTVSTQSKTPKIIALGDGDSITSVKPCSMKTCSEENRKQALSEIPEHFIQYSEQDTTDFEKALMWIIKNNENVQTLDTQVLTDKLDIDVYWANGGDLDHTLGNMTMAVKYQDQLNLHYYTDHQYYRVVSDNLRITGIKDKTISLFPFPEVTVKKSHGLLYPMLNYHMQLHTQQSLRNRAVQKKINIESIGTYFIFIENS